jgi:hypothetical protein
VIGLKTPIPYKKGAVIGLKTPYNCNWAHTKITRFSANSSAVFNPDYQTAEFHQNDSVNKLTVVDPSQRKLGEIPETLETLPRIHIGCDTRGATGRDAGDPG